MACSYVNKVFNIVTLLPHIPPFMFFSGSEGFFALTKMCLSFLKRQSVNPRKISLRVLRSDKVPLFHV